MIRIQTENGPVTVDAKAEDVTISSGHLKISRDRTTIAQFRNWDHWHELPEATAPADNERTE